MITEPEYLEELVKLEEGKKNKVLFVALKSRIRDNIQNKSTKRKKKKKNIFSLHHLQKNVKQIYLMKAGRKMLVVAKI